MISAVITTVTTTVMISAVTFNSCRPEGHAHKQNKYFYVNIYIDVNFSMYFYNGQYMAKKLNKKYT